MPTIVFVQPNGITQEVAVEPATSVMKGATANLVAGIIGECGGDLSCATCHVFIAEAWFAKLAPMTADEEGMLEATSEEPTKFSRRACQVSVVDELDGIVVHVPE